MTAPRGELTEGLRRHHERVAGMLADPHLYGDLLLIGILLARGLDIDDPAGRCTQKIAEQVYGSTRDAWRVDAVLLTDVRRYEPPWPAFGPRSVCQRPMVRREGPCGHDTSNGAYLTDPATGEQTWMPACRRHRDWLRLVVAANEAELAEHPPPRPAANAGGVLARHLPEMNWEKAWRRLRPDWTPPPEGAPYRRPALSLVTGSGTQAGHDPADRPALVGLPGGWS
jgi:hypothetical protein